MRTITLLTATAIACSIAQIAVAQGPPPEPVVYLRGNSADSPHHTTCVQRQGFVRVGTRGEITGPKDQDNIFTIPPYQRFSITDIHIADSNDTDTAFNAKVALYAFGLQGEIRLWIAGVVVPPKGTATYDKSFSTPIVLTGPTEFCYLASGIGPSSSPQVIVTGRIQ